MVVTIKDSLREMEENPDESIKSHYIWTQRLESWGTGLKMHEDFNIEYLY